MAQEVAKHTEHEQLAKPQRRRLVEKMALKYGVESGKLMDILKATAFRQPSNSPPISNEQMAALLIVSDQYGLNPFTKEIYAFPDKQNGIVPIVGVDGWSRMINRNEDLEGIEFQYSETIIEDKSTDEKKPKHKPCPEWCEVLFYRKGHERPTVIREYFDEVYREPFRKKGNGNSTYWVAGPWQSHTKRMLRHKALIQGARIAFSFSGIYDEDEGARIIEGEVVGEDQLLLTEGEKKAQGLQEALTGGDELAPDDVPKGAPIPEEPEEKPEDDEPAELPEAAQQREQTPEDKAKVEDFFKDAPEKSDAA